MTNFCPNCGHKLPTWETSDYVVRLEGDMGGENAPCEASGKITCHTDGEKLSREEIGARIRSDFCIHKNMDDCGDKKCQAHGEIDFSKPRRMVFWEDIEKLQKEDEKWRRDLLDFLVAHFNTMEDTLNFPPAIDDLRIKYTIGNNREMYFEDRKQFIDSACKSAGLSEREKKNIVPQFNVLMDKIDALMDTINEADSLAKEIEEHSSGDIHNWAHSVRLKIKSAKG